MSADGLFRWAASLGYRIEAVWSNDCVGFDLVHLEDDVVVLTRVGTMDIECYLSER